MIVLADQLKKLKTISPYLIDKQYDYLFLQSFLKFLVQMYFHNFDQLLPLVQFEYQVGYLNPQPQMVLHY